MLCSSSQKVAPLSAVIAGADNAISIVSLKQKSWVLCAKNKEEQRQWIKVYFVDEWIYLFSAGTVSQSVYLLYLHVPPNRNAYLQAIEKILKKDKVQTEDDGMQALFIAFAHNAALGAGVGDQDGFGVAAPVWVSH